jgi:DNA-binding MarR family transcriptional regulator
VLALGSALGLAERALTRLLLDVLAETGTPEQTWYAFRRLAVFESAPAPDAFRRDLREALDMNGPSAAALLDEILAAGLMREASDPAGGDTRIELTVAGQALLGRIQGSVAALVGGLVASFDPADIQTTIRTLTSLTEGARALHEDAR